ncbi:hypothetical protein [Mastigocoleus testarum]|uniref:Uncharacterized protein n=1 Tax=Mastigocoleus testarum BC008 TaxID=371196 RepID=A0A0V7ZPQ7_9CYAN|nr:hypothetical protein [Mastigocoleus testarum]KST66426.1 hypothetical protein BC008_42595 [Mastigocoleus testarum BC008]
MIISIVLNEILLASLTSLRGRSEQLLIKAYYSSVQIVQFCPEVFKVLVLEKIVIITPSSKNTEHDLVDDKNRWDKPKRMIFQYFTRQDT